MTTCLRARAIARVVLLVMLGLAGGACAPPTGEGAPPLAAESPLPARERTAPGSEVVGSSRPADAPSGDAAPGTRGDGLGRSRETLPKKTIPEDDGHAASLARAPAAPEGSRTGEADGQPSPPGDATRTASLAHAPAAPGDGSRTGNADGQPSPPGNATRTASLAHAPAAPGDGSRTGNADGQPSPPGDATRTASLAHAPAAPGDGSRTRLASGPRSASGNATRTASLAHAPPASSDDAPTATPLSRDPASPADDAAERITAAFPLPAGATRLPTDAFGASLRELRLRPPGTPVRTHDGRLVPISPVRVVDLPLVKGDLQQCADTAIRLRAEWLRDTGQAVSFHATSGDPVPWARVAGGEIPYAEGRGLKWRAGRTDWEGYLRLVFMWAGTASLVAHDTVPTDAPRAGDMLVQGGFPGHAIIIVDAARRGEQTLVLLAQGFMPAQDLHVLVGPQQGWWILRDPMITPSWTFEGPSLRRWRD